MQIIIIECTKSHVQGYLDQIVQVKVLEQPLVYHVNTLKSLDDAQFNENKQYTLIFKNIYETYKNDNKLRRANGPVKKSREQKNIEAQMQASHEKRMKEIIEYMKNNIHPTKYLHKEMLRMVKTSQILDSLRRMVAYLEDPKNIEMQNKVIKYYQVQRLKQQKAIIQRQIWTHPTNNLVINIVKDPFNDGVV